MSISCPRVGLMLIPSMSLLLAVLRLATAEAPLLHIGPPLQVHRCACRLAPLPEPADSHRPACQKQT